MLTPDRYVGIADMKDDYIPFEEQIENMTANWPN